ncbi:MAG: hypothetical protein ACREAM_04595, partial [Blastocatellia bacterium]
MANPQQRLAVKHHSLFHICAADRSTLRGSLSTRRQKSFEGLVVRPMEAKRARRQKRQNRVFCYFCPMPIFASPADFQKQPLNVFMKTYTRLFRLFRYFRLFR